MFDTMCSRAALLLLVTMLSSSCAAAKVAPPTFGTAERKFALRLGSYVKASPAMSKDGTTVYVGTGEGCATGANTMYAINTATGTPRWSRFAAAGPSNATCLKSPCYCALDSSPSLDSDGNIYFGSMYGGGGGYFQKYDKNGNRVWEENMLLWVIAKPLIGDEERNRTRTRTQTRA